jgi:hypothetical protein
LTAGLAVLRCTYDLSDEVLYERWLKDPHYQSFSGEFFPQRLVSDRSALTRWRRHEDRLQALYRRWARNYLTSVILPCSAVLRRSAPSPG